MALVRIARQSACARNFYGEGSFIISTDPGVRFWWESQIDDPHPGQHRRRRPPALRCRHATDEYLRGSRFRG